MPQKFNEQEFSDQLDAITHAAKIGNLKDLKDLHGQLMAQHNGFIDDPHARELLQLQPIAEAAAHNHVECVAFLIPLSDTHSVWSRALDYSVQEGHMECVKILLPHSSHEMIFQAMIGAAYHQHWDCVNTIFDFADPEFHNDFQDDLETTLAWSSQYHQYDLLKRLYPLCNIERLLAYATTNERWNDEHLLALRDYHSSVQQHKILSEAVEPTDVSRRSKI